MLANLASDPRFEGVSEDVASLAAPLMQKHNVPTKSRAEEQMRKEQKQDIIKKNLGRIERQVEDVEQVDKVDKVDN